MSDSQNTSLNDNQSKTRRRNQPSNERIKTRLRIQRKVPQSEQEASQRRFGQIGGDILPREASMPRLGVNTTHILNPRANMPHPGVIVQPAMSVNAPNDQYEVEANQVADAVMRMPSGDLSAWTRSAPTPPKLQLQNMITRRPERVQRSEENMTPSVTPDVENRISQMNGGGQPLPEETRSFFESRMGADFSGVRVHTDGNAASTSQAIQARAFTSGNNIAFNSGQYNPGTSEGKHLLAHELTHTVQQGAAGELQRQGADIQRDEDEPKSIKEQLNEAMDGLGVDKATIMSITANATDAEKQEILNDATLVARLASELTRFDMLQVLGHLNAPLKQRLNVAMDGWGADMQTILDLTANATDAEKQEVLNDADLVARLASELSQKDMLTVLNNINAPLKDKLNTAMDGWGADVQVILDLTANATDAEKQELLNDAELVTRLATELSRDDMLTLLNNINAPLKDKLNMVMNGWGAWGADVQTILDLMSNATDAEKEEVLNDAELMAHLATSLSRDDMLTFLNKINAPLKDKLNTAMKGWWADVQVILDLTSNATDAEKEEIANDTVLVRRLLSELSGEEMNQVVNNLNLQGATEFTNTTDTGNSYTSLLVLFQDGVTISKDVQFIEEGTFASGKFEALKARTIGAVTTYLSGKYKLKIESADGTAREGDGEYPITVQVVDNPSADYPMKLHGGEHGRSGVNESEGNIYELGQATETLIPDITLAHESAHMILGASDEYANASVSGRVIHTDHSLMGNYYNEGIAQAEIKARHFEFLVTQVNSWFPERSISIVK